LKGGLAAAAVLLLASTGRAATIALRGPRGHDHDHHDHDHHHGHGHDHPHGADLTHA
jgi:ABC-type Zn2+ transport system substrate-binding protein/surface adhesin